MISGTSTFYLPADAVMTGGVTNWLVRDQVNSVRLATDAAGAVVERSYYQPYGSRFTGIASQLTSKGFIGARNDTGALLYLTRAIQSEARGAALATGIALALVTSRFSFGLRYQFRPSRMS